MRRFTPTLAVLLAVFAAALAAAPAQAVLIYQYIAGKSPDDGANSVWEASTNNSIVHGTSYPRDWDLTGHTFVHPAASAYPGISSSYYFDGTGGGSTDAYGRDDLPLGGTKSDDVGASSTWEVWFKPDRTSLDDIGDEFLIESGGGTSGLSITLRAATGGVGLRFRTEKGNTGAAVNSATITDLSVLRLDEFNQVVGVVDPDDATQMMRLYLNGNLIGSQTSYQAWQDGNNVSGLAGIAGAANTTGGSFLGEVAIVNIYDDALTDAQVLAAFLEVTTVPEPATAGLAVLGLAALGLGLRRRGA